MAPRASTASAADPYEIPAQFVAGTASPLLPAADYAWTDLIRVDETGEVLALGDALLLRIADGKPFVTLGMARENDDLPLGASAIAAPDARTRVVAYARIELGATPQDPVSATNVLVESVDGRAWTRLAPPALDAPDGSWWIDRLVPSAAGGFYAVLASTGLYTQSPRTQRFDRLAWLTRLFEYRDGTWRDAGRTAIGRRHRVLDACTTASGHLLVVGRALELGDDGTIASVRGFAAARDADGGEWTTIDVAKPPEAGRVWSLTKAACGPASRHWLGAEYRPADAPEPATPLAAGAIRLYRVDEVSGGWQAVRLPTSPQAASVGDDAGPRPSTTIVALAVDDRDAPWLSLTDQRRALLPLWRYERTRWVPYPLPHIDGVDFYTVRGLVFAGGSEARHGSASTGWAISSVSGGAVSPHSRGVLLRLDGGAWRLQAWKWSRLRQRGFGWFGNLR